MSGIVVNLHDTQYDGIQNFYAVRNVDVEINTYLQVA